MCQLLRLRVRALLRKWSKGCKLQLCQIWTLGPVLMHLGFSIAYFSSVYVSFENLFILKYFETYRKVARIVTKNFPILFI